MIDAFSLLLTHGLLLIACWRLARRDDLDQDPVDTPLPADPRDA